SPGGVLNVLLQRAGGDAIENRRAVKYETYRESARGRAEGQPTPIRVNPRNSPSADKGIQQTGRIAANLSAAAEGKLVDPVRVNDMTDVEVGVRSTHTKIGEVANYTTEHRVRDARLIIDRVGQGVVEVEFETS